MIDTAIRLGRLAERVVRMEPRRVKQELIDEIVLALREGEKALLERVPDPVAHGPFFDGLQDMPYGGSRQTTQPIETPEEATKAIQELRTLSGECTCLSISRDPLCVHHGDEAINYLRGRVAFYERHTDKQANELVEVTLQRDALASHKRKLLQVLQLAESVYRLNAVGDGEPSSVLDCMQAAIIEAQR